MKKSRVFSVSSGSESQKMPKKLAFGLAVFLGLNAGLPAGQAGADCNSTSASPVLCTGTVSNTVSIGNGPDPAYDNWTVTIGDGVTPTLVNRTNGDTVISLHDQAAISLTAGSLVQGNSNSGGGGHYNTGPNVIEVNSRATINISAGATVEQLGSTTNGEAINVHGYGNVINNNGTIHSANGAALWFQDTTVNTNYRNTVVNYGTISTAKGDAYNVFGSSMGSNGPGLNFQNYGTVQGSLRFGNGDDSLLFGTGSVITGNVDGGGGTNDLTLNATNISDSATLGGAVANFSSITKTGAGSWAISGQVPYTDPNDPHAPPLAHHRRFTEHQLDDRQRGHAAHSRRGPQLPRDDSGRRARHSGHPGPEHQQCRLGQYRRHPEFQPAL